jgi:hypothetical protein
MVVFILPMARFALSAVFVASGMAKLLDLTGTRQSLREFGLPKRLITVMGYGLPALELAVAAALTATRTAQAAAAVALVLLTGFTLAIVYHLARGSAPRCNCFGTMSKDAVGRPTVVRNVILMVMAATVLVAAEARSGMDSAGWLASMTAAERLSLATSFASLVIFVFLWRGLARMNSGQQHLVTLVESMRTRSDEIPIRPAVGPTLASQTAPPFEISSLDGVRTSLDDLLAKGRMVLLLFVDPACSPCDGAVVRVSAWHAAHDVAEIAVISRGSIADNRAKAAGHQLRPILLQNDREVAEAYNVHGTPCIVAIGPDRRIAGVAACGEQSITAVLDRVAGDLVSEGTHAASAARHGHNGSRSPVGG